MSILNCTCPRCASTDLVAIQTSKGGTPLTLQCRACGYVGEPAAFPVPVL